MGFHVCEYITREQAKEMGLRNQDVVYSSGDVIMTFASGQSWIMPDMARLYVELGWVPPQKFIDDVMNSELTSGERRQMRGASSAPTSVGYLNRKDHPLPLKMSDKLPAGFLEKLEDQMKKASTMGHGFDGFSGRRQTKGFRL